MGYLENFIRLINPYHIYDSICHFDILMAYLSQNGPNFCILYFILNNNYKAIISLKYQLLKTVTLSFQSIYDYLKHSPPNSNGNFKPRNNLVIGISKRHRITQY